MREFSKGRVLAGCAIGIGCGILSGASMLVSAWFLPVPILMAFLWVWSGWPSVVAGAASTGMMSFHMGGPGLAAAAIAALVLPGALAALLTQRRKPFYSAVALSIAIQWAALICVTVGAWLLFRRNLVDALTDSLSGMIFELPRALQHFLILQIGQMGMFGTNTGINFSRALLTDAQLDSLISQMLQTINTGLKLSMPAYVLTSGATAGALSYAAAAYVRIRRGDDPPVPFIKPEGWRLTPNLILGPIGLAAVCLLLDKLGVSGADAAYLATMSLARVLFTVQAVGALERRFKASGMPPGRRTLLIAVALVIGQGMMPFIGAYSALVGSQGLITKLIKKRMDGKGEE